MSLADKCNHYIVDNARLAEENERLRGALKRLADAASNCPVPRAGYDFDVEELDFAVLQAREALNGVADQPADVLDRMASCAHDFQPDGESRIRPGTVRSYLCSKCGMRASDPTSEVPK